MSEGGRLGLVMCAIMIYMIMWAIGTLKRDKGKCTFRVTRCYHLFRPTTFTPQAKGAASGIWALFYCSPMDVLAKTPCRLEYDKWEGAQNLVDLWTEHEDNPS